MALKNMVRALSVVLLLALLACAALADGTFFRPRLQEARPTIPYQRAVLKFDGQEQIMLVESTLEGPQGTYGWVVPLPSKPSYVKAVNPAYVEQSFNRVKPVIRSNGGFQPELAFGGLILVAVALTSGLRHRKKDLGIRILLFFAEVAGLLVVYAVFFPVFAQAKFAAKKGVADAAGMERAIVEDLGTIGSYQVSVVSGEDGLSILTWLKEHDLAVDNDALPVIEAYAKEGWCFLAAEIRKNETGAYPPHPLKAVFPSDHLVYPMRLTGLQDQPLRLELLVVSDHEAEIPGMKPWACDNSEIRVPIGISSDQDKEIYSDWHSGEYAMAKHGAVWTYLRGEFKPDDMRKDFLVDWKPMERSRAELWDKEAAITEALHLGILYLCAFSMLSGLVLSCWSGLTDRIFGVGALSAIALAAMAAIAWYGSVQKVETVGMQEDTYWGQQQRERSGYR